MSKRLIIPFTLAPLAVPTLQAQSQQSDGRIDTRPNIILFVVDDVGWQDTSLPFRIQKTHYNRVYEALNMERFIKQGVILTQAYTSSISSPARCSLITGTDATHHRITDWTYPRGQQTDRPSDVFSVAGWNVNGVRQVPDIDHTFQATPLTGIPKDNGCHTIHYGEAHFGAVNIPGENPYHMGFEVNIAEYAEGGLASYLGENSYGNRTDGKPNPWFAVPGLDKYWGTDIFVSEALTLEAIKALDRTREYNQPLFLYMARYAIHVPVDGDKRFYQKHINKELTPKEAAYAALIESMDKSLGNLMGWLDKNGETDNTIVISMGDNGELSSEPGWRDDELHTQNSPLNSGEGSAYKGGVREPMIIRWPGVVKPDTKCDKYLIIEDFYPSILEMAQMKHYKTVQPIDDISLIPLLKQTGGPSKRHSLYWNFPNHWGSNDPDINPTCTVHKGDWKLIYYYENGKRELFNIPQDIGERNNPAAQHPDIMKHLSRDLSNYLYKVSGQCPSLETTGESYLWPDGIK